MVSFWRDISGCTEQCFNGRKEQVNFNAIGILKQRQWLSDWRKDKKFCHTPDLALPWSRPEDNLLFLVKFLWLQTREPWRNEFLWMQISMETIRVSRNHTMVKNVGLFLVIESVCVEKRRLSLSLSLFLLFSLHLSSLSLSASICFYLLLSASICFYLLLSASLSFPHFFLSVALSLFLSSLCICLPSSHSFFRWCHLIEKQSGLFDSKLQSFTAKQNI